MSLEKIHLRKFLRLAYAPRNKRISWLRADIRNDLRKAAGNASKGGDFHGPFWADAKNHVAGFLDLRAKIAQRIVKNKGRKRLYDLLGTGFLAWWYEKRRWRNEPFIVLPEHVKTQLSLPEVGGCLKIENLLALEIGGQSKRIIYPYFAEEPSLPEEGRRLGLSLLKRGLSEFPSSDFRVLDVLRASSYGTIDHQLRGDEYDVALRKYEELRREWDELRTEY
jgi:hypothetical protein